MTILPDHAIADRITAGSIEIRPYLNGSLQPSSYDLRLGPLLLIATPDGFKEHNLADSGPYRLQQPAFILGATLEWIRIPDDLVGVLVGKSSRAREGIQVECAGYVDPGWRGNLTLELTMLSPIPTYLMHGMMICQIRFEQLAAPCARPYGTAGIGRYQNSDGPIPSRAVPSLRSRVGVGRAL